MKNWICLVLLLSGLVEQSVAQVKKPTSSVGHAIQVSLKPYQNTKIYIGTNYGNNKVLADSCVLNEKSEGVFKGAQKLTPGIYFLVNPKYNILFDFLVDEAQNFKIVADTNNLSNYSIVGSSENDLFKEYSVAVNKIGSELAAIENKFKTATTSADSSLYRTQYISKDKALKDQRTSFMKAHPKSMMSYLLNVMQRPEAPAIPVINGKADSLYPFYYVKNHFWDDVVFNDNRLIRTPFFEAKLDEYFKNYVARDADSIIEEVQYMLTVAKTGKEIYPFLLFKFTNKYISPEFMGQDKVFLHLYQNFFAKGDTVLLNEASKKSITERAYSMMANQLGLPAPALDINTIDDKPFSLYKTAAPYTFIAFWDPTCSHCKVEIPQLDSMYKASWKALGVQIVGVNINYKELPAWKKFIADNQINNWFHVYQTEAALNKEITNQKPTTIRQLYDVFKTPTFYLLDANKRIIAKNLTLNQFDDFLKSKAKKP
jgi:thiol-disulfide isomerase/thioredoxin